MLPDQAAAGGGVNPGPFDDIAGLAPGQQPGQVAAEQPGGPPPELPPHTWTEQEWRDFGWFVNEKREWVAPTDA